MRERPKGKSGANGKGYDPERLFLPPDDDLAPNRPGETLRVRLDADPRSRPALALARLLGHRPVQDHWRRLLAAEQQVGTALEELTPGGWEVLHSIALPGDARIAHLLIGPGGVFGIGAEPVRRARVSVDAELLYVPGERDPRPSLRRARQNAARAAQVLSQGCGFPVPVRAVVVLVGTARPDVSAAPEDVRVLTRHQLPALGTLGGVLRPERVDRIHTVARNRRVWLWG
ncbi:nuclease-related domain-containing protein [Streptomyces orinoci]|uniref:Nuclease-related domain-containing protein n=1 Tax=Streptomyces orinoci TaxID=67339 RepID=A0ABV3K799_STRON|nr:nuclease-related domain-containing protein [Streptomyces orinoci]